MSVLCLPVRHALGVGPSEAQPSIQQTFNMRVRDEQVPWKGASAALGLYIYTSNIRVEYCHYGNSLKQDGKSGRITARTIYNRDLTTTDPRTVDSRCGYYQHSFIYKEHDRLLSLGSTASFSTRCQMLWQ